VNVAKAGKPKRITLLSSSRLEETLKPNLNKCGNPMKPAYDEVKALLTPA